MAWLNRSPVDQAAGALNSTLGDVKVGAIKGAVGGALGTLGSKVADSAQSATNNGDLGKTTRKARKQAAKAAAQVAQATEAARNMAKDTDVQGKLSATGGLLQTLGNRAGGAAQAAQGATRGATSGGVNLNIDANDIPRLLRGLMLVTTGLATLFAPGSPLDASRRQGVDTGELANQTRQGIDTAADMTQQRIKDIVELAKDALATLSDTLTSGIETAEERAQQALDETEKSLTKTTDQVARQAKGALPKQNKGGSLRWLFFGLLAGGIVAFLSSPLSGPIGERVRNLQRDLGLGGDEEDDSQYWPSPPSDASTTTPTAATGAGPGQNNNAGGTTVEMKTETWNSPADAKEDTGKA